MVSGPLRPIMLNVQDVCEKYWWTTLLYVQNYVNPMDQCIGPTWYLSVDMQLFILSPLIIYPLWRWRYKFIWTIPVLILLSMACTFATMWINHFQASFLRNSRGRQMKTYFPTHTRFGSWAIGVLLGYLLHQLRGKKMQLSQVSFEDILIFLLV